VQQKKESGLRKEKQSEKKLKLVDKVRDTWHVMIGFLSYGCLSRIRS